MSLRRGGHACQQRSGVPWGVSWSVSWSVATRTTHNFERKPVHDPYSSAAGGSVQSEIRPTAGILGPHSLDRTRPSHCCFFEKVTLSILGGSLTFFT